MGGGDLNMKKSWHPVLLVNQEKVWKAEKSANEEKKKLAQLRKEQEEERQLAELQRLQEQSTGKKRVEKLDWMYAAPSGEGGALGGARLGEKDMEDYLLGKKRVDEVLAQGDKNIGNMHKDFIAVQNANTARDTASKIREDPMFLIKKQELAAIEAMKNDPAIRRKLKEMQRAKEAKEKGETKEERKARRRAEKEDRKRDRHDRRHARDRSRSRSRTPRSDYSDDRDYRRHSSRRDSDRYRTRSRSYSPRRERDSHRRRDDSPRRRRDDSPRGERRRSDRPRDEYDDRIPPPRDYRSRDDDRVPPPRHYPNGNGHGNGQYETRPHPSRPSAMDMADRPTSSRPPPPPPVSQNALDEQRAARLAAMQSSASQLDVSRTQSLAQRAAKEKMEEEKDAMLRKRYGKEEVHGAFYKQQTEMALSDSLARRGGKGLQKEI